MSEGQTIHACAVRNSSWWPAGRLISLWEPEPRYQAALREWVKLQQAISRTLCPESEEYLYDLVWYPFPTCAALEAANAALHEEQTLEWLDDDYQEPGGGEPIAPMWKYHLLRQRLDFGPAAIEGLRQFLERVQRECVKNSTSST